MGCCERTSPHHPMVSPLLGHGLPGWPLLWVTCPSFVFFFARACDRRNSEKRRGLVMVEAVSIEFGEAGDWMEGREDGGCFLGG